MKRLPLVVLCTLLLSGSTPQSPNNGVLERELQSLTERGLRVQLLGEVVEATDPVSGQKWQWSLDLLKPRKPLHTGLPTLTIDLRTIDTSLYNRMYHYVSSVAVSSEMGYPLQVADFDANGLEEIYGIHQTQTEYLTRVYESTDDTSWNPRYQYPGLVGIPNKLGDIDNDSFVELFTIANDTLTAFTQTSSSALPTLKKFGFKQWHFQSTGIPNQLTDMNADGTLDMVYAGSEPDSIVTSIRKTYVATFDTATANLMKLWSKRLAPNCIFPEECTGQIAVGDFDGDGRQEFVTSAFNGNVYVVEHVVGDSFAVVWSESLSVAARVTTGDVDGNGSIEFIVGGNQLEDDGLVHLRTFVYEATGNNAYKPVFHFNIYPVGYFFVDLYQTSDVDLDGKVDLLLSVGGGSIIIKGISDHSYDLFSCRAFPFAESFSVIPFGPSHQPHLFLSRHMGWQPIIKWTDIYRLDSMITTIENQEFQPPAELLMTCFPNPFNSSITISYRLDFRQNVILKIMDILGRELTTLARETQDPGDHYSIWSPEPTIPSGVYFCTLHTITGSVTKKILLLK